MNFTAKQIAEILQGEIQGDETVEVNRLAKIEEGKKGSLTFLANPKYNAFLYSTNASIAIVDKDFKLEKEVFCTLIRVEDAYQSFSKLLEYYNQVKLHKVGIEQPSFIDETAKSGENLYLGAFAYIGKNVVIGDNVKIYPHAYIGDNVKIGDNTTLFSGVKIYSESVIGNNCNLHADVIVGCDGFGFAPNDKGEFTAVPQTGNVMIEDNVDIGSATTIDRATLGSTIIRKGVKLDNQIQIAHNVEVGKNTVIAAQTGVAGSTKIGESCMIGGQVGFAGHLTIGNGIKIQAQSGIARNLKDGSVVQGSPAFNYTDWNKSYVHFKNLGKLEQRVSNIEKTNK